MRGDIANVFSIRRSRVPGAVGARTVLRHFTPVAALLVFCVLMGVAASSWATVILPPEGSELNHTHMQFQWMPIDAVLAYQLQVVEDDGRAHRFQRVALVIDVIVGPPEPRVVVTSGLEFDKFYAWRVRGFAGGPLPRGPIHRFRTAALPDYLPEIAITTRSREIEPGLTMFN
jgi:hypothetical protein